MLNLTKFKAQMRARLLKNRARFAIIGVDRVGFSSLSAAKMGSCLADEGSMPRLRTRTR